MHSSCPNCDARLKDFEFSCDRCGWSLDRTEIPSQSLVQSEEDLDSQPTEVDLFLDHARDSIDDGDFPDAIKFLNRAIVDAPPERLSECFSLRGYAHLKNGDFELAENDCTEAIDRHWSESQTFAWRAAARGEQDKWRSAFDDLGEACRIAGNQRDPYLQLIQSYTGVASAHFRELIKDGQDDADMFFDRGWVYFRSANYAKAQRDFELALELDSGHPWASLGLAKSKLVSQKLDKELLLEIIGRCEVAMGGSADCQREALKICAKANHQFGHLARASKDLMKLCELAENNARLLIECGELRQQLGDNVAAIGDFSEAMEVDPDQTFALQRRGDCYAAIRNYRLAIDDYTKFLRSFPDDLSARVKRGQVYSMSGRPDLALNDFDRALSDDRTCCDAYLGRSNIFLQRNQLDQALTECEKAVRLDNQRPEAFETLAEIYFKLCDYGRAIEEFGRAIRLAGDPNDKAQYLYRRGAAQYELDDFAAALIDFRQASKLRPNHAGTMIWNAAACSRLEKWPEAILGLQEAITVRPSASVQYQSLGKPVAQRAIEYFRHQLQRGHKDAEIYSSRGLAYQFIGENDQAIADFTAALELRPDHVETLVRRGQTYAKLGDHQAAIDDFRKVIHVDESNHWARFCRALSRAATGDTSKALQDVVKAIKMSPRHPRYHVLHAELLQKSDAVRKRGDWTKVVKAYDRAIRIDSADAITHQRRAAAHAHSGQVLEAIHDFTRALELDPKNSDMLVQRGHAYLKNEQREQALEDFELALTRNPKHAKAYSGRATVLISQDRYEYTLIWLTKAIHRFKAPGDLAEIIFARGKVFYQMKRFQPAIADFSTVFALMRNERKKLVAATLARGIALVQLEEFENAARDFDLVLKINPNFQAAQIARKWLQDRDQQRPSMFNSPEQLIRPTKPAVVADPLEVKKDNSNWKAEPPYNSWILRIKGPKEFGPVPKETLDIWVSEGRIDKGMKLLRADWSKWKRAQIVYDEIEQRLEAQNVFPGVETRRTASTNGSGTEVSPVADVSSSGEIPAVGDVQVPDVETPPAD